MRLSLAFGALSVAAGLFVACGDDEGTPGPVGGSGGSAGRGGTGGQNNAGTGGQNNAGTGGQNNAGTGGQNNAGTGGQNNNAGTGGTSGGDEPDAGDASTGDGGNAPCTGCVQLNATVAQAFATENAMFQIALAGATDLTGETMTFRMRGLTLDDQIVASPFATDGTAGGGPPTNYTLQGQFTQLTVANGFDTEGQFEDVVVDIDALATANGDFNPADVIAIGIQIGYNGAIGAESTHTVSVLLDSITFSSGVTNVTFTNDAEGLVLTQFGVQTAEVIHH